MAALSATFDEFHQHPLISLRQRPDETLAPLDHDPPLRLGLLDAERAEHRLRLRRNPNTELWVLPHLLTRAQAGRRSSASGTSSPISTSSVPGHDLSDRGFVEH